MDHKGFYDDNEKKTLYTLDGVPARSYTHHTTMKIYQGADFLIYSYDDDKKLRVHTSVMVVGINVENEGVTIQLLDKKSYRLFKVGYEINYFGHNSILSHVPYRCFLERSVKETQTGFIHEGLSAGIVFMMKSDPQFQRPGHMYIVPHGMLDRYFYQGEVEQALQRQEESQ